MSNQDNIHKSPEALWKKLFIAAIVVISIWALSWIFIDIHISNVTDRGAFGDKFGAVNALFSGLAFAGLIVTLLYQKEELKLQREELSETRKELNAQRLEFHEQNRTMRRQRFESTFFSMLSLQQEIVSNLSYDYYVSPLVRPSGIPEDAFYKGAPKIKLRGRETFEGVYKHASIQFLDIRCMNGILGLMQTFGIEAFRRVAEISRFNHYFRHLCSIYEFVDSSDLISDDERCGYANIVRNQLSDCELAMLFYNCLTMEGVSRFNGLIKKYNVLQDLRDNLLADVNDKNLYLEKLTCQ